MIIVTVGMQLGFDRLIKAMDALAPTLGMPVIAQTGEGSYQTHNMEARAKIASAEFEALLGDARLIVSHAGIGTVLTAARCKKPIRLVPRRGDLGEHRNDHQFAAVRKLAGRPGILVAQDETGLQEQIAAALALREWTEVRSPTASQMHDALARFIEGKGL
ncbi:MAG: glycosyltransferase [Erythrobacter sp.]